MADGIPCHRVAQTGLLHRGTRVEGHNQRWAWVRLTSRISQRIGNRVIPHAQIYRWRECSGPRSKRILVRTHIEARGSRCGLRYREPWSLDVGLVVISGTKGYACSVYGAVSIRTGWGGARSGLRGQESSAVNRSGADVGGAGGVGAAGRVTEMV